MKLALVVTVGIVIFILLFGLVFILFKKIVNKSIKPKTGVVLGFLGSILIFGFFILLMGLLSFLKQQ
jgi:hypothetical protein